MKKNRNVKKISIEINSNYLVELDFIVPILSYLENKNITKTALINEAIKYILKIKQEEIKSKNFSLEEMFAKINFEELDEEDKILIQKKDIC